MTQKNCYLIIFKYQYITANLFINQEIQSIYDEKNFSIYSLPIFNQKLLFYLENSFQLNIKTNSIPSSKLFSRQNDIFLFCPNSYYQFGYFSENREFFSKCFQYNFFQSYINKINNGNIKLLKDLLNDASNQILIDNPIDINLLLIILNNEFLPLEMYEKIIKYCNKKNINFSFNKNDIINGNEIIKNLIDKFNDEVNKEIIKGLKKIIFYSSFVYEKNQIENILKVEKSIEKLSKKLFKLKEGIIITREKIFNVLFKICSSEKEINFILSQCFSLNEFFHIINNNLNYFYDFFNKEKKFIKIINYPLVFYKYDFIWILSSICNLMKQKIFDFNENKIWSLYFNHKNIYLPKEYKEMCNIYYSIKTSEFNEIIKSNVLSSIESVFELSQFSNQQKELFNFLEFLISSNYREITYFQKKIKDIFLHLNIANFENEDFERLKKIDYEKINNYSYNKAFIQLIENISTIKGLKKILKYYVYKKGKKNKKYIEKIIKKFGSLTEKLNKQKIENIIFIIQEIFNIQLKYKIDYISEIFYFLERDCDENKYILICEYFIEHNSNEKIKDLSKKYFLKRSEILTNFIRTKNGEKYQYNLLSFFPNCKICYNSLQIGIYFKDNFYMITKCINNHYTMKTPQQFLLETIKESKEINCINKIKGGHLLDELLFVCYHCTKIFCEKCKFEHGNNYIYIPLLIYDSMCLNHLKKYYFYCVECQKNLCDCCLIQHENIIIKTLMPHKIIKLNDMIDEEEENFPFQKKKLLINAEKKIISVIKKVQEMNLSSYFILPENFNNTLMNYSLVNSAFISIFEHLENINEFRRVYSIYNRNVILNFINVFNLDVEKIQINEEKFDLRKFISSIGDKSSYLLKEKFFNVDLKYSIPTLNKDSCFKLYQNNYFVYNKGKSLFFINYHTFKLISEIKLDKEIINFNFLKSNDIIITFSDKTMHLITYNLGKNKLKIKQEFKEVFKFKEIEYRELLAFNDNYLSLWTRDNKKELYYLQKDKPINLNEIIIDVYDSEKKYIAISNTSIFFISKKNIHDKIEIENTLYTIKKILIIENFVVVHGFTNSNNTFINFIDLETRKNTNLFIDIGMVIEIDYIGNSYFLFLKNDKVYTTKLIGDNFQTFNSKNLIKNIDKPNFFQHIYIINNGMICIRINYEEFEEFFFI